MARRGRDQCRKAERSVRGQTFPLNAKNREAVHCGLSVSLYVPIVLSADAAVGVDAHAVDDHVVGLVIVQIVDAGAVSQDIVGLEILIDVGEGVDAGTVIQDEIGLVVLIGYMK